MKSLSKFNISWDKAINSIYGVANKSKSFCHYIRVNPNMMDINRFFIFKESPYTIPPSIKSFIMTVYAIRNR